MNKKVAILVIHGIGEQEPFETMDAFVKPFADLYLERIREKYPNASIRKKHSLAFISDWIESYVSLIPSVSNNVQIDIYEYYWAHMTQHKITTSEVIEWLFNIAEGAKDFYARQKNMKNREKNDTLFTKDGEFKILEYLIKVLSFGNFLKRTVLLIPVKFKIIDAIARLIARNMKGPIVDKFGDVTLYTTTDKKSKYFGVRKRMLNGAVQKTKLLIENPEYADVLLIGHSLGSVIAYDTLDRLNKMMTIDRNLQVNASKIKGLITFGSPLDKIAFFFDEQINKKKQDIRYAIVSQLHAFRRVNVDITTLENTIEHCFKHVKWLNFWTKPDPVSGHLDVYDPVDNIEIDFSKEIKVPKWLLRCFSSAVSIQSHSLYWQSDEMYQKIMERFNLI